jgi:hypothetical protein
VGDNGYRSQDPALNDIRFKITDEIRKNIEATIREEIGRQVNRQITPMLKGSLNGVVTKYIEEAVKGQVGAVLGFNAKGRTNDLFKNLVKAVASDPDFATSMRQFVLGEMNQLVERHWANAYKNGLAMKMRKMLRDTWREMIVREIQEEGSGD